MATARFVTTMTLGVVLALATAAAQAPPPATTLALSIEPSGETATLAQIMTPSYEGDPDVPKVVKKDWYTAPARPSSDAT